MFKYIFPIILIVLGLIIGQLLRRMVVSKTIPESFPTVKWLKRIQQVVLLGINPFVTLVAFWGASLSDIRYAVLPVLGVLALIIGGVLGFVASKILRHRRDQTGAMFCASSFTNLGSFGTLLCYLFFGEPGYVIVALYRLFEQISYFLIGFPVAKAHGSEGAGEKQKSALMKIVTDPYIIVYLSCIIVGSSLNLSGVARPEAFTGVNQFLIPGASLLLTVTVGFNMHFGAVRNYLKECVSVSLVKFLIVPVIITGLGYLAGLDKIGDGMALRVVFVLSAMPTAFNALIPPQLYKLDVDLANSVWLFTSGIFLVMIPVLYFVQGLL